MELYYYDSELIFYQAAPHKLGLQQWKKVWY